MANPPDDIRIEDLERAVYARDHDQAGRLLLQLLSGLASRRQGQFVRNDGETRLTPDEEQRIVTRIAGALLAMMADPSLQLSQAAYEALVARNGQAGDIFQYSGYRSSEHIWHLLATPMPGGGQTFSEQALRKCLAISTLSSTPPEVIRGFPALPSFITVPALMGLLSNSNVLTSRASEARNEALQLGHLLDTCTFSDSMAELSMLPWMLCSYGERTDKHEIKRHLNAALRRWMAAKAINIAPRPQPPERDRPVLAVVLEWAHSNHAMLRCYGDTIRALRPHFHLVGVAARDRIDESVREMFDEVCEIPYDTTRMAEAVRAVEALAPDVMWYPSVGMALWAICLANLRIAPLQLMSIGHPATSHSPEMDCVLQMEGIDFDPACFSERAVVLPGNGATYRLYEGSEALPATVRENPEVIRIGIPAKLFKLSADFLAACREIAAGANRPVEFHFFPNENGAAYVSCRQVIEQAVPGARVWPHSTYPQYMAWLNQCDIALGAFTFGNTNGAVDALLLQIPCVALDGPEAHQGSEQQLMRPVGLPEWLIARTRDDYIAAVLRLVNDDSERVALSNALEGRILQVFEHDRALLPEHGRVFEWLWRNRERVKAWPSRVIRWRDVVAEEKA